MPTRSKSNDTATARAAAAPPVYPFTAIVGQDEMKLALLLNVITPSVGGALIMGHRGTGKSTAVRALAELLPPLETVAGCPFNCDPQATGHLCQSCACRLREEKQLPRERASVPVVDLPLGATEDRVCGTIDIERAMRDGVKAFEPGLLARANRGFLYIDEVNLLEDHLVDLLLDVSVTGRNTVEREGISIAHPARFVLIGSGNPEEGELRPQLLDRFGLYAEVETVRDTESRMEIVERREAFERDPAAFLKASEKEQAALRRRIERARSGFASVEVPRTLLRLIVELCVRLGVDGHRGEITVARAARALAAFEGRRVAEAEDVRRVASFCLRHRLRRDPLEPTGGGARIDQTLEEILGTGDDDREDDAEAPRRGPSTETASPGEEPQEEGPRESQERVIPPVETALPDIERAPESPGPKPRRRTSSAGRRNAARSTVEAKRGRYVRSAAKRLAGESIALDATLRSAAASQASRRNGDAFRVTAQDLRFKRFRRRSGTLFILAVDASGSMAVNRINQAKGALACLLRRAYVRRDRVALVSFRQRRAETLLAPTCATARAKKLLDALPVGGATPLAAALLRSLEIARRARAQQATQRIHLVLFTDGRANVLLDGSDARRSDAGAKAQARAEIESIAGALRGEEVSALVVDTQNRFTSTGEGRTLAAALGGRYAHLPPSISENTFTGLLGEGRPGS